MVAAPVRRRGDQRDQGGRDDDAGDRPAPVYEHLTPRLGAAMEDGAGGSEVGVGHLTAGWTRRDVSARPGYRLPIPRMRPTRSAIPCMCPCAHTGGPRALASRAEGGTNGGAEASA